LTPLATPRNVRKCKGARARLQTPSLNQDMSEHPNQRCSGAWAVAASVGRPSASWLSMNEERRSRCPRRLRGKGIGPERMLKACASIAQKLDLALASLRASQLVLCVRLGDPETALAASEAALRGGIRCVEVTMTVPDAADVISTLSIGGQMRTLGREPC
jgi:hypothetical protein